MSSGDRITAVREGSSECYFLASARKRITQNTVMAEHFDLVDYLEPCADVFRIFREMLRGDLPAKRARTELQRRGVPISEGQPGIAYLPLHLIVLFGVSNATMTNNTFCLAELNLHLKRFEAGAGSAKFSDLVKASKINNPDFEFLDSEDYVPPEVRIDPTDVVFVSSSSSR